MANRYPVVTLLIIFGLLVVLGGCAAPQSLPGGPTPIPTLIPATEPGGAAPATEAPSFAIQSYPARLPSASQGQPLYDANCATCHGASGEGTVPGARNFNDLDFMRGETPASFYAAITEGRGEMPSFRDTLSSDERWDIVFFVWRFSTTRDALAEGEDIYGTYCAACHGEDGTGVVLGAADFTDLRVMDSLAPRDFYLTVTQGQGSMPAWQGRLSQDERWAVIDYLRTFAYDPTLSGESAAGGGGGDTIGEVSCDAYASEVNPFSWDDATAAAAGQVIYEQSCAMCHGADGTGGIPNTPDLTSSDWQEELRAEQGEMLCIVAEGRDAMPKWRETLSIEQIWQVLTFIASLGA